MKHNKCVWKVFVLAIVLSFIYFIFYSKISETIYVRRVYMGNEDDIEPDAPTSIPVTLGFVAFSSIQWKTN